MLIKAYGLFWDRDDVRWFPGAGKPFRLLGRRGTNLPGLQVADFRHQKGLYVLYNDYGPYYVGLTYSSLGQRLKDHALDQHSENWTRFSWFGFRKVSAKRDTKGLNLMAPLALKTIGTPKNAIADIEALVIATLGCGANTNTMHFRDAVRWTNVPFYDDTFLTKVAAS